MKECCFRGVTHEGDATGEIKQVGGVKNYVATPSSPNGIGILYIADAFGLEFNNNKLLADDFARAGFTTVIPDIFHGDPVAPDAFSKPGGFDIQAWLSKHGIDTVEPVLDGTIRGMKEELGLKKIAAVGYCFGGRYVIRYLGENKIDAGFAAHPSLVEDTEVEAIKGPISFAFAETDHVYPPEKRATTEAALAKLGVKYQCTLYGGTQHGFSVRCDLKDPKQKYAKEAAFFQATSWFEEWLS